MADALALVAREAQAYVDQIDSERVLDHAAAEALADWAPSLPEAGSGAVGALGELIERARPAATRSSGPRFFHFVVGGTTPAALGADWLASALDQNAFVWASSPLAAKLETIAIGWLRELFELPPEFGGSLVTGTTMANLTGLAAARNWWAERHGVDAEEAGLSGLPAPPVLTSGYIHASAVQAIGMLGLGRASVRRLARDGAGRLDLKALADALAAGGPAILIANAGEVNAGDFDPIAAMADLAAEHDAWLHVDGAFGLFARIAPRSRALTGGIERADSLTTDVHKWLNFPTTAASSSSASRPAWRGRSTSERRTCRPPTTRGRAPASSAPRTRAGPGRSPSGRRCARTAATATGRWSSATWRWPATRRPDRGRARAQAARRAPAQHRHVPRPAGRRRRPTARRPQSGARRGAAARRPRVRGNHRL
jgi:Pyridoxal-dependent decarboxylase conserved domain